MGTRKVGNGESANAGQRVRTDLQELSTKRSTFEQFFRKEFPSMVALAAAVSGRRSVSEDIAQEAFVRAHRKWDQISRYDSPGTWVRRVTINLATNVRVRSKVEAKALLRLGPAPVVRPAPEQNEEVWKALAALPKKQRIATTLYYLEGYSTKEICDILECTEATARVHLHRGRKKLVERLGDSA